MSIYGYEQPFHFEYSATFVGGEAFPILSAEAIYTDGNAIADDILLSWQRGGFIPTVLSFSGGSGAGGHSLPGPPVTYTPGTSAPISLPALIDDGFKAWKGGNTFQPVFQTVPDGETTAFCAAEGPELAGTSSLFTGGMPGLPADALRAFYGGPGETGDFYSQIESTHHLQIKLTSINTISPGGVALIAAKVLEGQPESWPGRLLVTKPGKTYVADTGGISPSHINNELLLAAVHGGKAKLHLPVDITVRKKGEAVDPTGLLVKKGEVITFDINGTAQASAFPLPANTVKWKIAQLKHDGMLTGWQDVPGEGPELDFTTTTGVVFQAKAVLTVAGGQPQDLPLIREKDARHADDSEGNVHDFHKKGAEDYFGVSDDGWQLDVRFDALNSLGLTDWRRSGRIYVGGVTWADEADDKCNIFIYHKCNRVNVVVPFTRGSVPGFPTNPPLAIDWWNDNTGRQDNDGRAINSVAIPGWQRLPDGTMPQPGFIVSRPNLDWTPDRYQSHVGIVDYDGSWVSAGAAKVNKFYHPKKPGYQPQAYRRYTGGN